MALGGGAQQGWGGVAKEPQDSGWRRQGDEGDEENLEDENPVPAQKNHGGSLPSDCAEGCRGAAYYWNNGGAFLGRRSTVALQSTSAIKRRETAIMLKITMR